MRIVITGGTGLIGSHLIPELITRGHEVTELRRYTATRGLAQDDTHEVIWFDLHDAQPVSPLPTPDIILHLGAMASNAIANRNPLECFDINATGTMRLLHAFRHAPDAVVVAASSSEVYAKPDEVYALNPYAASKIALEEIVRSAGHPWIIMRPFNTYGRASIAPVSVVDKWCRAALLGEPIMLGDMETVRDYVWRTDHVNAYLKVVDAIGYGASNIYGRPYDFGTGVGVTLTTLLDTIAAQVPGVLNTVEGYSRTNDVPVLIGDPTDAGRLLGWEPTVTLEQGVALTLEEWRGKLGLG